MSIYELLKTANATIDHYASDLYVKQTPETLQIIQNWAQTDKENRKFSVCFIAEEQVWLEIPFAYDPYWRNQPCPPCS